MIEYALLCFETACKQLMGKPPYEMIADAMGISTTQLKWYLADCRKKRLAQGQSVPPPLVAKKPDPIQEAVLANAGETLGNRPPAKRGKTQDAVEKPKLDRWRHKISQIPMPESTRIILEARKKAEKEAQQKIKEAQKEAQKAAQQKAKEAQKEAQKEARKEAQKAKRAAKRKAVGNEEEPVEVDLTGLPSGSDSDGEYGVTKPSTKGRSNKRIKVTNPSMTTVEVPRDLPQPQASNQISGFGSSISSQPIDKVAPPTASVSNLASEAPYIQSNSFQTIEASNQAAFGNMTNPDEISFDSYCSAMGYTSPQQECNVPDMSMLPGSNDNTKDAGVNSSTITCQVPEQHLQLPTQTLTASALTKQTCAPPVDAPGVEAQISEATIPEIPINDIHGLPAEFLFNEPVQLEMQHSTFTSWEQPLFQAAESDLNVPDEYQVKENDSFFDEFTTLGSWDPVGIQSGGLDDIVSSLSPHHLAQDSTPSEKSKSHHEPMEPPEDCFESNARRALLAEIYSESGQQQTQATYHELQEQQHAATPHLFGHEAEAEGGNGFDHSLEELFGLSPGTY